MSHWTQSAVLDFWYLKLHNIIIIYSIIKKQLKSLQINHIDLSPNYASLLISFTNSMAIIVSNMSPIVTGMFVNDNPVTLRLKHKKCHFLSTKFYFIVLE